MSSIGKDRLLCRETISPISPYPKRRKRNPLLEKGAFHGGAFLGDGAFGKVAQIILNNSESKSDKIVAACKSVTVDKENPEEAAEFIISIVKDLLGLLVMGWTTVFSLCFNDDYTSLSIIMQLLQFNLHEVLVCGGTILWDDNDRNFFAWSILEQLKRLHQIGAHCDIKPVNIMIVFSEICCGDNVKFIYCDNGNYLISSGIVTNIEYNCDNSKENKYHVFFDEKEILFKRCQLKPTNKLQFDGIYLIDTGIARFGLENNLKLYLYRDEVITTTWYRSPPLWYLQDNSAVADLQCNSAAAYNEYTLKHSDMWAFGIVMLQVLNNRDSIYMINSIAFVPKYIEMVQKFVNHLGETNIERITAELLNDPFSTGKLPSINEKRINCPKAYSVQKKKVFFAKQYPNLCKYLVLLTQESDDIPLMKLIPLVKQLEGKLEDIEQLERKLINPKVLIKKIKGS